MNKLLIGSGLGVLAIYALGTLILDDKKHNQVSDIEVPNEVVSVRYIDEQNPAGSQTAYLDPVTGELTSRPADSFDNSSSLKAEGSLAPVKITTYTDGSVKADLNGRFRTPLMATIGCDGELTTGHSDDLQSEVKDCGEAK